MNLMRSIREMNVFCGYKLFLLLKLVFFMLLIDLFLLVLVHVFLSAALFWLFSALHSTVAFNIHYFG